tara:strand:+ start:1134 stop:1715 length:582 start_codon:yes stop_codon:yes gene_type:complete
MNIINEKEAIRKLNKGNPLIFQTDTLPAIGCNPDYSEIIFRIKKRDKKKPLILMGSNIQQVMGYVDSSAKEDFKKMAHKFWPGKLTLIVPISNDQSLNFISKEKTLGIRIPNSPKAQSLISKAGPLATSSANVSGIKTAFTAETVSEDLPEIDLLGPVPWEKCSGLGSTIISWKKKGEWKLIREGQISSSKII